MTEQPTARQKLEAAVTKVGRAFDELVRTVEKNGAGIERADLDKVFAFLLEVHQGSHNKAALSLSTAIAATGGFSLDTYVPSALTAPVAAPVRAPMLRPDGLRPGERVAGQRKNTAKDPLDDPDASDFFEE